MLEPKLETIVLPESEYNDLKSLLESISNHGALVHAQIADNHYESYLKAKESNERKVFAVEIFCKLLQSVEDYGAFCMMWLKDGKNPLEAYLDVVTPKIVKFYRECDAGMDKAKIRKIWGIPPADELIKQRLLADKDRAEFEKFVSAFMDEVDANFKQIGVLFRESGDSARKKDYGDIVNMYFNAKHGVKVFFSTETSAKVGVTDDYVSIIIGPGKLPSGQKMLKIGKFNISQEYVHRMVQNTRSTCDKLQLLARMRLEWMENEYFIMRGFHEIQRRKS